MTIEDDDILLVPNLEGTIRRLKHIFMATLIENDV